MSFELMQGGCVFLPASIISQILFAASTAQIISPVILLAGLGIASVVGFCVALNYIRVEQSALVAIAIALGIAAGFVGAL